MHKRRERRETEEKVTHADFIFLPPPPPRDRNAISEMRTNEIRKRERERETERERQRETERDRERQRETERQRDRETERGEAVEGKQREDNGLYILFSKFLDLTETKYVFA